MAKKEFRGTFTAIVTPFKKDESVDYDALAKIIEFQIKNGVTGIVPCGTTGESPTLDYKEHDKVIEFTIKQVKGRVKVIAGTGSNCTREAIEMTKHAELAGADAVLQVNPYYNKPTQEGLYLHFKAVANATKLPIVLYNIKGRTGVNLETPTLLRLIKDCKNIIAMKEASGDMTQIKEVITKTPEYFSVLSGDDNLTQEVIASGGDGVISVASNIVPDKVSAMVNEGLAGNHSKAKEMSDTLMPLFKGCFIETNPIPIKFMVAQKGLCEEVYRLPMCEMSAEHKKETLALMKQQKLI
jgi:4-hydroxy-tetrahydrodipicolinate synthase